jgi:hypothetical protein
MRRKRQQIAGPFTSILSLADAALQMNTCLDALNKEEARVPVAVKGGDWDWEWRTVNVVERKQEIRQLVGLWQESCRDLNALFKKYPELQKACTTGKAFLIPDRDGKAQLAWSPTIGEVQLSPQKREALVHFIRFLVNPLSSKLQGPCARCESYYLQKRVNNKTYCRSQCGSGKTALASTQARREKAHKAKLEIARMAVLQWKPKHGDWKEFVVTKVNASLRDHISTKWVTRVMNNGKLEQPLNIIGSQIRRI